MFEKYFNKHRIIIVLLLLVFAACEKEMAWTYSDEVAELIAVESIISNTNTHQSVKLTYVRGNPNAAEVPVTDAQVSVEMAGQNFIFLHDSLNPGVYKSTQAFSGVIGVAVHLKILHKGKNYKATDLMPPVSSMVRAVFSPVHDEPEWYHVTSAGIPFYSAEQAMWVIDADWSFLPEFDTVPADSCKARLFFFSLHNIDVGQIFAPAKEKVKIRKGAKIEQAKYSLSAEHAIFWRSVLLETEWRGGFFDVSQGEVYTNLNHNALGFFGASAVIRDTYFLQ